MSFAIRTPDDAEAIACSALQQMGYSDARLTKSGPDGGVDVISAKCVAQVKAFMAPVGRAPIQNLKGVASHLRKQAIFFSLNGYTSAAIDWADAAGVALFRLDHDRSVTACNRHAEKVLDNGSDAVEDEASHQAALRETLSRSIETYFGVVCLLFKGDASAYEAVRAAFAETDSTMMIAVVEAVVAEHGRFKCIFQQPTLLECADDRSSSLGEWAIVIELEDGYRIRVRIIFTVAGEASALNLELGHRM